MACNHHDHDHHHEDHDHELKFHYSVYTDKFELYAEADPFIIGLSSNILNHFSNLPDFTPLTNGTISLKLISGEQIVEQRLEEPQSPGTYIFDITPAHQGEAILEYNVSTEDGDFKIIIPEIRIFSSVDEAIPEIQKHEPSKVNTTVFSKEQSWKTDFATAYPVREPFGYIIKTAAQVQASSSSETVISAGMSGIISNIDNSILDGNNIYKGQKLFSIHGGSFADNNSFVRYMEAKNNFERAKADFDRSSLLVEDKIISDKDMLQSKNAYENARSIYENLDQHFNAGGQTITSPIEGFVRQLYIKNGQFVEAGQPLVLVSQNKMLVLRAEIQNRYLQYLQNIVTANIRIPETDKIFTLEELNGKIISTGKAAGSDNYLIPLNIEISNSANLMAGSFVELYLKTITNTVALTLPVSAIIEEQGVFFVYVQITPELFEKREIKIGATDGIKTEIIQGINENERIVTKGAIMIKLAQSTGELDAHSGHIH